MSTAADTAPSRFDSQTPERDSSTDASRLSVRLESLETTGANFIERWKSLASRSLEDNAFLTPQFVLAALKLNHSRPPLVLLVESADDECRLLALGLFEPAAGSRLLPLKHLRCWRTEFTYFDGMLIDRGSVEDVCRAVFEWLGQQSQWHGLAFEERSSGTVFSQTLEASAAAYGSRWVEDVATERATLDVEAAPEDPVTQLYSKSRRKSLRHSQRRLAKMGEVEFRMRTEPGEIDECIDTFLQLEAMGWKGEQNTAMNADARHAEFCRDLVHGFAEGRQAVFFELRVDQQPVAVTMNVLSNRTLFALKVAWHHDYAAASPCRLCEIETVANARRLLPDVQFIDSCARPGSYIEDLWPWRRSLTSGVFPTSRLGRLAAGSMRRLKDLNRLIRSWQHADRT